MGKCGYNITSRGEIAPLITGFWTHLAMDPVLCSRCYPGVPMVFFWGLGIGGVGEPLGIPSRPGGMIIHPI